MSERYSSYLRPDTLAIFLFHGVIPRQKHAVRNYTWKHIESTRFINILDDLTNHGTPFSLPQVVEYARSSRPWPSRAFVLTFDDGFANNYSVAAPLLKSRRIPACFYVTTQFVGANHCSWIDMIEYAVETQKTRRKVALPALGIDSAISDRDDKIEFLKVVRKAVKTNRAVDPYDVASTVWQQLNLEKMEPDEDLDKKMSWTEVQQLQDEPLFTVGGHGHTHRILSYLTPNELKTEIDNSMRELARNLKKPVEHYSYPEGLDYCYSPSVISELQRHGIVCAPSAISGVNALGEDLFHLKRIMVV